MSVRNILDGTIPVGGSGELTPESDIAVNSVYSIQGFKTPALFRGKDMTLTQALAVPKIDTTNINVFTFGEDEVPTKIQHKESLHQPSH